MSAKGIINSLGISLVLWALLFILVAWARAEELPQAPSMTLRQPVETYEPDQRMLVHNYPDRAIPERQDRIVDWSFVLGHAIYGASNAFDNWETQRYLGTCAWEGNPDLGRNPSARAQAIHGAVEFGAVVGGDLLLKWWGRKAGVPRWANMLGGNLGSAIGTGKHLRGGMQWIRLCN